MDRPYVISWNLTYRCNLACEHCYLDAGGSRFQIIKDESFADRSELNTEECFKVIDQIAEHAPESVTILTGGEPLLRKDILEIIRYGKERGLWIVVGTNGVKISVNLADKLKDAGVRGMALSLDSLTPEKHDEFRRVKGAWANTVSGARILNEAGFPFIVQTTVGAHNSGELEAIARLAYEELGAKVWNLYFLVQTGRGSFVSDISQEEYDDILQTLSSIQRGYSQRMMVNAKCAPHYGRVLFEDDPQSPFLKTFSDGAGGCPAGTHYMGIRPNGDMTPCPYLPVFAGNLKKQSFSEIWNDSDLFKNIRARNRLGGRCGSCEFSNVCGGCRARAYGVTGDYMAEDPLCSYEPGKYQRATVQQAFKSIVEYGMKAPLVGESAAADSPSRGSSPVRDELQIEWTVEANERIKNVPLFVRGMVVKAVESHCRKKGIPLITDEVLAEIRSNMPTQKVFSRN